MKKFLTYSVYLPVKQMDNQFSGAQSVFFENGPRISPRKSISSIHFKEFQP